VICTLDENDHAADAAADDDDEDDDDAADDDAADDDGDDDDAEDDDEDDDDGDDDHNFIVMRMIMMMCRLWRGSRRCLYSVPQYGNFFTVHLNLILSIFTPYFQHSQHV
jgi:hypothetical protein